jgi:hypothetical protein
MPGTYEKLGRKDNLAGRNNNDKAEASLWKRRLHHFRSPQIVQVNEAFEVHSVIDYGE